jgi:hypothetical protein
MVAAVMMPILLMSSPAVAADPEDIDRDANAAFPLLYQTTPAALRLAPHAKAILMTAASYGQQAGVQSLS